MMQLIKPMPIALTLATAQIGRRCTWQPHNLVSGPIPATGTKIHSLRSDVTDATDDRFAKLLPAGHWQRLPSSIRRRFSKRIGDGEMTLYAGHVTQTSMTVGGRVLANFARLIGSPLPLTPGATGPALVTVTEDQPAWRPGLDTDLCPRWPVCPGGSFDQTVYRCHGPGGICRARCRHGPQCPCG